MTSSSAKDVSVYDFNEHATEWASQVLLRKSCRSPKKPDRSRLTKDDFKDCFSRNTESADGISLEYDMSSNEGKRAGINTEEQHDSITAVSEFGNLISGPCLHAKGAIISEKVSSETKDCSADFLRMESFEADALAHAASSNDEGKQMTCTMSELQSEEILVDLTSEDEGLSGRRLSPSNAVSDPSDDGGASEYSNSDTCHNSDDHFNMDTKSTKIVVIPEFGLYGDKTFLMPRLTFSEEWVRLEIQSHKSSSDEVHFFQWGLFDIEYFKTHWLKHVNLAVAMLSIRHGTRIELETFFNVTGVSYMLFAVNGSIWHTQQHRIRSLSDDYNAFWISLNECEHQAEDTLFGVHPKEFSISSENHFLTRSEESLEDFVFPKGDPDAVTISKRDLELLQPEAFINDTLIDFYIKYLQTKISQKQREACHFFNSFFFRKLADLDKAPGTSVVSREAFQRVRKWTRKVDIFQKDYIFIPVNYCYHWSLIVICHPGEAVVEDDNYAKTPCILHMDSIKGTHADLAKLIQSYLWEEWQERHMDDGGSFDIAFERFSNMPFISLEVPQQNNFCDCGLFLLHYVEMFLSEAPAEFNLLQLQDSPKFLTKDWFLPDEASLLKRYRIRELIHTLHQEFSGTAPAISYGTSPPSYEGAQSDTGTSQGVEFVMEDGPPNQTNSVNSLLYDDKVEQIPVCHMDEATPQIQISQGYKDAVTETFGVFCGEYNEAEGEHDICHNERFLPFSQGISMQQLKFTLRQASENLEQTTENLPSGSNINEFSGGIFPPMVGTNETGQCQKEIAASEVLPVLSLGQQLSLSNEFHPIIDPLINQKEDHSGNSQRVPFREGSTSTTMSTASDSSYCVRKLVSCDTTAGMKQKALADNLDAAAKGMPLEENMKSNISEQSKNADEINLSLEPSSHSDIPPCHAEKQVAVMYMVGEVSQKEGFHESIIQKLQQKNVGKLQSDSSDNVNSIPSGQQKFDSPSAENLKLYDVANASCYETVAGSFDNLEKGIGGPLASCQDEQRSFDCEFDADFGLFGKCKEDCAGSAQRTAESGNRSDFRDLHTREFAESINKTIENVEKSVNPEKREESPPDFVDDTCKTPENKRKCSFEADAECLSSDDLNSPPQELPKSRTTRSRKSPSTVPKARNQNSKKGTPLVQDRPRTRSVTKNMDSGRLSRGQRRRKLDISSK
eukprot:Gb_04525 [translate_table: standard]